MKKEENSSLTPRKLTLKMAIFSESRENRARVKAAKKGSYSGTTRAGLIQAYHCRPKWSHDR